jgi:hypothetical protein
VRFITENFLPLRIHVREQAADFKRYGERYGAHWTPAILQLDADGVEQYRIEGFLPVDDLLAQLALRLCPVLSSESAVAEVASGALESEATAEAIYWAGVSRYKVTGEASALEDTAAAFSRRFQNSPWAKKASVWDKAHA